MRVPSDKMAPTLRWYIPKPAQHTLSTAMMKENKMPIGGQKKAKRRSEFRRDSLHVFSQDHCWTVEEEVFEQSSSNIYSFGGNSV